MKLYDPTASGPERTLCRAPVLDGLDGRTIGILENGKLNAPEMLTEIAALFAQRHGCKVQTIYHKSNASAPAPAETLSAAVAEVDFLITGLGD